MRLWVCLCPSERPAAPVRAMTANCVSSTGAVRVPLQMLVEEPEDGDAQVGAVGVAAGADVFIDQFGLPYMV